MCHINLNYDTAFCSRKFMFINLKNDTVELVNKNDVNPEIVAFDEKVNKEKLKTNIVKSNDMVDVQDDNSFIKDDSNDIDGDIEDFGYEDNNIHKHKTDYVYIEPCHEVIKTKGGNEDHIDNGQNFRGNDDESNDSDNDEDKISKINKIDYDSAAKNLKAVESISI